MSANDNSLFWQWIRGSQLTRHSILMTRQSLFFIIGSVLLLTSGQMLFKYFSETESYERYLYYKFLESKFLYTPLAAEKATTDFTYRNGRKIKVEMRKILNNKRIISVANKHTEILYAGFIQSLMLDFILFIFLMWFTWHRGKKIGEDEHVRGSELIQLDDYNKLLKQRKLEPYLHFGDVGIPPNAELQHISLCGTTGSGKSTVLNSLIKDIRRAGHSAIIYSTSTEFIRNFFDPQIDFIMNPLDDRSVGWKLWNEVEYPYHYDNIADALISDTGDSNSDPFWNDAAKILVSYTARKMAEKGDFSTVNLIHNLLTIEQKEMAKILEGTPAQAILAEGAEKTALSVRAVLATHLRSFTYLRAGGDDFSIRSWAKNHQEGSCVFITNQGDQAATLRPLISVWMDVFASALLSLDESKTRRIYLVLDELQSLQKLPTLQPFKAQSRKYGGCSILGYQAFSQLEETYGKTASKTLIGLSSSRFIFRQNDDYNADIGSRLISSHEIDENNEGRSFGTSEMRDGSTQQTQTRERRLVLPAEIMNLPDFQGYAIFAGKWPVVRFKNSFQGFSEQQPGFIYSTHKDHVYMLESSSIKEPSDDIPEDQKEIEENNDDLPKNTKIDGELVKGTSKYRKTE